MILEIGFGMGETTAAIAHAQPQHDFLGLEVHAPGVGALLKRVDEQALTNVRVIRHDAVDVVTHMLAPDSLAGIHVYFPDPWPKKRHHKRRLLQPAFVRLLASRLAPGGYLHAATDWEEYAQEILATCSAEPRFGTPPTASRRVPRGGRRPSSRRAGASSATASGISCSGDASVVESTRSTPAPARTSAAAAAGYAALVSRCGARTRSGG